MSRDYKDIVRRAVEETNNALKGCFPEIYEEEDNYPENHGIWQDTYNAILKNMLK